MAAHFDAQIKAAGWGVHHLAIEIGSFDVDALTSFGKLRMLFLGFACDNACSTRLDNALGMNYPMTHVAFRINWDRTEQHVLDRRLTL